MGLIAKPKSSGIYGTLIRVYPQSFRDKFDVTMVQTFDDLLENEPTAWGRMRVWTRTLIDLPFSAAKEYITKGEELTVSRNTKLLLGTTLLAVVIVGVGSFWAGSLRARQSIGIQRVSTAQLADAMQKDAFYSDYGNAALLFNGTVARLKDGNNVTLVTFTTHRPYDVTCQFPSRLAVKIGQTISVAAPGGSADRQRAGVLLHNCTIN